MFKTAKWRLVFCLVFFILLSVDGLIAQPGYRGIVPMRSTCQDVKTVWHDTVCGNPLLEYFEDDQIIRIEFTSKKCETFYGKKWDVPIGTVVSVSRSFRKPLTLTDLGLKIDESRFIKSNTDAVGQAIYETKNGGLTIYLSYDIVSNLVYTPVLNESVKSSRSKIRSMD